MRTSTATARRLMIGCQGLDDGWLLAAGVQGVAEAIERLGQVQIDTIAVVQRSHHHILWTRCPGYSPDMLDALQTGERRIFEHWSRASAACYLPLSDYRFYLPLMERAGDVPRTRHWLAEHSQLVDGVLSRIRDEGPLASADFDAPPGWQRGQWWSSTPAKQALEWLLLTGRLMVSARRNFQRLYDLPERVLPADTDRRPPEPDELARFVVRRELGRLGLSTLTDMTRGWMRRWREDIARAIEEMTVAGEVAPVTVDGEDGRGYYALVDCLERAESPREGDARRLHILSPFDGVLQRRLLAEVFGFDYTIECYLPAAKRRFGYFSLPILWGEEFVGRLDPKAERATRRLLLRHLVFEPRVWDYETLLPALAAKLHAFAAFNGCDEVVVERSEPESLGEALRLEMSRTK